MTVKLKHSKKSDSYTLKGLQWEHLEVIAALLANTRLGSEPCRHEAYELIESFEKFEGDLDVFTQFVKVSFSRDKQDGTTKVYNDLSIDLTQDGMRW